MFKDIPSQSGIVIISRIIVTCTYVFVFQLIVLHFSKNHFALSQFYQCWRRDTCHVYLHKLTSLYVVFIVFQCVCVCFYCCFSLILIMVTILRCAELWVFCFSFLWLSFLFAMSPSDHFAGLFTLTSFLSRCCRQLHQLHHAASMSVATPPPHLAWLWVLSETSALFVRAFVFCLGFGMGGSCAGTCWDWCDSFTEWTVIWSTRPSVQIQKLPGDSAHLLYVQTI